MDRLTFQTQLSKLAIALSAELPPEKIAVYWDDLGDLTDEQFVVACTRARREWDRPFVLPPIAVLLRYAADAVRGATAGAIVDGESAWEAFTSRVLRRYSFGVTKAFDWPDELTRAVVRDHLGIAGPAVHTLATLETDFERERLRRRFVAEYDARRGTARAGGRPVLRRLGDGEDERRDDDAHAG